MSAINKQQCHLQPYNWFCSNQQATYRKKDLFKYCNVSFVTTAYWNLLSVHEYKDVIHRWMSSDANQGDKLPSLALGYLTETDPKHWAESERSNDSLKPHIFTSRFLHLWTEEKTQREQHWKYTSSQCHARKHKGLSWEYPSSCLNTT